MNVTAFIRQTATAKKKATIYIRVRDNDTKTDIKAATDIDGCFLLGSGGLPYKCCYVHSMYISNDYI